MTQKEEMLKMHLFSLFEGSAVGTFNRAAPTPIKLPPLLMNEAKPLVHYRKYFTRHLTRKSSATGF